MPGLIRGVARTAVIAGTASSVAGRVNHRQQQKWSAQEQQAYEAQQYQQQQAQPQYAPPPPAPAAPAESDPMAEITKLGQMHTAGLLTDEEFAAAKAKILGI